MKEGYIIRDQEKIHFITATVVDWIDVFTRKSYKDIVIDCLAFCIKNKGMLLYGYVIMSNHVHLIVNALGGNLSDVLRDLKRFSTRLILKEIAQNTKESRRDASWVELACETCWWCCNSRSLTDY